MVATMPVIVVGADTPDGMKLIEVLADPAREVRAFVSDPDTVTPLRRLSVKVALGDVSDDSHVSAAAMTSFSAVLIATAASDGRERSFASSPQEVMVGWAKAVTEARVRRAIWVIDGTPPPTPTPEVATVDPNTEDWVRRVVELDEAQTI
jgi:putative NADH-flavin reductase